MSIASPYAKRVNMTDTLTMTADTALVVGLSGLSGGKNLTLPLVSDCDDQDKFVVNLAAAGGTITVVAATGDSVVGRVTCAVATGLTLRHDSIDTWYGF